MEKSSFARRWSRIFKLDPQPEVSAELEFHVEQRVRDYIAQGMDPEAARRATLERLGDLRSIQHECTELLKAERPSVIRARAPDCTIRQLQERCIPSTSPLHVKGDPASFAPQLREVATAVDPAIRLHDMMPLADIQRNLLKTYRFWFQVAIIAAALVLTLSLAGIYSITSFTVASRSGSHWAR